VVAARVAAELGLDRPLPEQFLRWLGHVLSGDLGLSYASRTPVTQQLASALGVSAVLTALLAAAIGIPAGVHAARKPGAGTGARPRGPARRRADGVRRTRGRPG
jgi:ABC-type dipeptide/oligopeptide/nickel transport system permease component